MIKFLFVGLWGSLAALGADYAAGRWFAGQTIAARADAKAASIEQRKLAPMNVPVVKDGEIQGYVIVQLAYTVDPKALKPGAAPPDAYLVDEAFRAIYSDDKLDFRRLEKYDAAKLTQLVFERVRVRLGNDAVKEVLVHDLNFVSKGDLRN